MIDEKAGCVDSQGRILAPYLAGEELYGDDFSDTEIEAWDRDEKEGFANLGAKYKDKYRYSYHALNRLHGFRYLNKSTYANVLGIGSAYGDEFLPILSRIKKLTILEPSEYLRQDSLGGMPVSCVKPAPGGRLEFPNNTFDLVTCLGVLHHVPNVTFRVNEIYRCLTHSGMALIREPIVSMGDWTKPREGLTRRERGLPIGILMGIVQRAGFKTLHRSYCIFPPIPILASYARIMAFNNTWISLFDALSCWAIQWNTRYHAETWFQKIRPASIYLVLKKS